MDLVSSEAFRTMAAIFTALLFVVWVLPGLVNRNGKHPEDRPASR